MRAVRLPARAVRTFDLAQAVFCTVATALDLAKRFEGIPLVGFNVRRTSGVGHWKMPDVPHDKGRVHPILPDLECGLFPRVYGVHAPLRGNDKGKLASRPFKAEFLSFRFFLFALF